MFIPYSYSDLEINPFTLGRVRLDIMNYCFIFIFTFLSVFTLQISVVDCHKLNLYLF